jgi:hypothetical protein
MHVHANQINANAQLDALYSAQKTATKREAARTRKKLSEFTSELADEACVVELRGRGESQEQAKRQNPPNDGTAKKANPSSESDGADKSISDWA